MHLQAFACIGRRGVVFYCLHFVGGSFEVKTKQNTFSTPGTLRAPHSVLEWHSLKWETVAAAAEIGVCVCGGVSYMSPLKETVFITM